MSFLDLSQHDSREKLDKVLHRLKWNDFPGLQALLLKVCTSCLSPKLAYNFSSFHSLGASDFYDWIKHTTLQDYFDSLTWSYLCWIAWLVFQGVTNTATSEPSLHLLSKLTVFSNVSLVDPSQAAGECYCFCVSWHSCFFLLFLCNFFSRYLTKRLRLPEFMS